MTASRITHIRFNTSPIRKKPQAGDERFLKGRGVWQVRQQVRVHDRYWLVSNGRPVWEWVDKGSDRDSSARANKSTNGGS